MQSGNPGAMRHGVLRHGNLPGDLSKSPRCCAKTRGGKPCRAPAMWSKKAQRYTRCRMHGGASTGPKTAEGRERCRKARWKHGRYSHAAIARRRALKALLQIERAELHHLAHMVRLYEKLRKRARKSETP